VADSWQIVSLFIEIEIRPHQRDLPLTISLK